MGNGPALEADFPDPTILQDDYGRWWAFATNSGGRQVQVATANSVYGDWKLLDTDMLPVSPSWATGANTWAPDVRQLSDGTYVMYFSGEAKADPAHHCVGFATSASISGPYTPSDEPFACDLSVGGAIDPSGFVDDDGRRYVAYKVDGNSIGNGGLCNNGIAPLVDTPIILQEVDQDGVTKIGDPVTILDRTDADGPLVEAPSIMLTDDGVYVLFFSSGCFTDPTYNVNYATASSVAGPYTRAFTPVVVSGQSALMSPGGATGLASTLGWWDLPYMAFHANCDQGRCMHTSQLMTWDLTVALVW
ncbi:Uu.00g087010.m01.CDS01 [Anthostomella pinea]|uniref:Uu.00g087010.m01.CDS01 n=1 Tax=Anthostomella pinea TaxID=933095 RepID=A0AAI8YJY2_9PEZI|nr:Uu.00g087010.m01.CDS01 [Anthostomella pinea]